MSAIGQKKALAYSTTTPIQASAPTTSAANIHGTTSNFQPWFVVGRGEYDGLNSNAKVYIPVGVGATLTIVNGGGYYCPLDIQTNSGPPQVGYQLTNTDPDETFNSGNPLWFNTATSNIADGNTACHNVKISIPAVSDPTGTKHSSHPGHTNFIVYYFTANMTNPCGDPNACNTAKAWKLSVTLTGSSAYQPYVGLSRNITNTTGAVNGKTTFGIYGSGAQSGSYNWDYGVQFAPFCDETVSSPQKVGIYDIDYKVYSTRANASTLYPDYVQQDSDLTADVQQDGRTDTGFGWAAAGGPTPKLVGTDWNPVAGTDHENSLPLNFNYDTGHRYLLEFKDLSYRNLVQVTLPFDQFDSLASNGNACNKGNDAVCSLNSSTTQSTKTYPLLAPGATVQFGVTFKNTGSSTWDPSNSPPYQWQTVVTQGSNTVTNAPNNVTNRTGPGGYYNTGNYTFTAPGAYNTTKTITFQILQSTKGVFGTKCTLILKTGPSQNTSNIDVTCEQTIINVNDPTPSANPVPVSVIITNAANGADTHTFNTTVPLNAVTFIGTKTMNTFDMWAPGMWPHNSYNFQLVVDGVVQAGATDSITSCMQVTCNGSGYATDAEPGQNGRGNVTVHFTNDAGRSSGWPLDGSDGGYTFSATANPGFVVLSPNPQPTSSGINAWNGGSPGNPVDTDVNVSVSIREDWTGDFTVNFQGPSGSPSVSCSGSGTPKTRPYFQVTQGDIDTGGGFGDATGKCVANTLSYISPINSNPYNAGLRAYANQLAGTGSNGDFGVLALGFNVLASPVGFYSKNNEIFAAPSVVGEMGGLLNQSAETDWHCVNDFFLGTRLTTQTDLGSNPTINVNSLNNQTQYTASGNVTLTSNTGGDCSGNPAGDIPAGKQTTLYISGNVTINRNICYAQTYDASVRSNVPYFALIVQGNITINYNVNQVDGLYVAQPSDATNGIFATCDGFCPNKELTVNGAVLAQTVRLNREHGTLGPLGNDLNGITTEPSEVFNYTPAMVIGQPYFSAKYNNLQALFSLPPVF